MAQVMIIGRITADFDLQWGQSKTPYVRFGIVEDIGYGDAAKPQYAQVWARNYLAEQLVRAKVHKGSLIWISGSLLLEEYTKRDESTDKRLKVWLDSWGFVNSGKPKSDKPEHSAHTGDEPKPLPDTPSGVIDGEREPLPE